MIKTMIRKHFLLFFSLFFLAGSLAGQTVNHWETAVFAGDTFTYRVNTSMPPSDWFQPGFDDSGWAKGRGGFGYGDNDDTTLVDACISVSVRKVFQVPSKNAILSALLHVDYDDGFIAWLNGVEIARSSNLSGSIQWDTPASPDHEAQMYQGGTPEPFYISADRLSTILVQGENTLAIEVHNAGLTSSDLSLIPFLSFGIANTSVFFRTPPSWFSPPPDQNFSSNLPIIIINTNGQTIAKDREIVAAMKIVDNPSGRNSLLDTQYSYNGPIHIEYHGQSSYYFNWPKKSYNIELIDASEKEIDAPLLGMPPGNDWDLYGPYNDKTLMRNALCYDLARRFGRYAPRTAFCEVVLNGEYIGLFVLIEKIRRDKNRVNIAKLDSTDIQGDDLTGGYIVKIDKGEGYEYAWTSPYLAPTGKQVSFLWHYPKYYKILQVQKDYIRNYITSFETALKSPDWNNAVTGYYRYIDLQSFVDYFLFSELTKNVDAYRISAYVHKDKDSKGGKLVMGPTWDNDLTFGNANYYHGWETYGWVINSIDPGDYFPVPFWWSRFLLDSKFTSAARCRWEELRKRFLHTDSIYAVIDRFSELTSEARIRNFEKYPVLGQWVWPNYYVGNTYSGEIVYMKEFIADRARWMDNNLPGTCGTSSDDTSVITIPEIDVYPNPFTDEFSVVLRPEKRVFATVQVVDITGRQMLSVGNTTADQGLALLRFNGATLPPGMYFIRVFLDNKFYTVIKVIKQKK